LHPQKTQLTCFVFFVALAQQFCAEPDDYWRFFFPGSIIGVAGVSLLFVSARTALMGAFTFPSRSLLPFLSDVHEPD
jgi:hypothetical protein